MQIERFSYITQDISASVAENAIIGTFEKQCLNILSSTYFFQNVFKPQIKWALSTAI